MKKFFVVPACLFWSLFACGQSDEWKASLPNDQVLPVVTLISDFDSLFAKTESQSDPEQALISYSTKLKQQFQQSGTFVVEEEISAYVDSILSIKAFNDIFFQANNPYSFSNSYIDFLQFMGRVDEAWRPYVHNIAMVNDMLSPVTYDLLLAANMDFGFEKPESRLLYYVQLIATIKSGY